MKNSQQLLKASLLSLLLLGGALPIAYAATDTESAVESTTDAASDTATAAGDAVDTTTDAASDTATAAGNAVGDTANNAQDTAQGFDDWGLLGLLGLLGLAGLGGRNRNVVVDGTRR